MSRPCPVCGSDHTGAVLKSSGYTDKGRVDEGGCFCLDCGAGWDESYYRRTDETVISNVQTKMVIAAPVHHGGGRACPMCKSQEFKFVSHDGSWRRAWHTIERFECSRCGCVWQLFINSNIEMPVAFRIWRRGNLRLIYEHKHTG